MCNYWLYGVNISKIYGTHSFKMVNMSVFWDVTPCSLAGRHSRYRGNLFFLIIGQSIYTKQKLVRTRTWFQEIRFDVHMGKGVHLSTL